jgi:PAS domain S-box-containing protein
VDEVGFSKMIELLTAANILIAARSESDLDKILTELKQAGCDVSHEWVSSQKDFAVAISRPGIDAICCVTDVEGLTGQRAILDCEEVGSGRVILISETVDAEERMTSVRGGAEDHLLWSELGRLGLVVEKCVTANRLRRERDVARTALRDSDRRFLQLIEDLKGYAIVSLDAEGLVSSWNQGAEELFGFDETEIIGQPCSLFYTPDDVEMGKAFIDLQMGGEAGFFEEEDWRVRKNGEKFWAHAVLTGQRDAAGELNGFGVVIHDITDQQQASEALRQSEEKYRSLVDRIPDVVWTVQENGEWTYVSSNVERMVGFKRKQIGEGGRKFWEDRIHDAERAQFSEAFEKLFHERQSFEVEFRFQRADGEWIWLAVRADSVYTQHGVVCANGILADVTDRRQADHQIRDQAQLLDLASDAIIVRDLEHKVLFWNEGAARMFGWTAEEVDGRNVFELHVRDEETFHGAHTTLLAQGEWGGEMSCRTRSGGDLVVGSRWTVVRDDEGKAKSILSIDSNVTEKKRLENQFLRSQRMESVGTMAGGVAQDIQGILGPIMLSAPLLNQPDLPEGERLQLVAVIQENAERGGTLVRKLMSLGRGVEGERVPVPLRQPVQEVLKVLRDSRSPNIVMDSELEAELWPAMGDSTHIYQVLMNLCANACDAMSAGGRLQVSVSNRILDEYYAQLDAEAKEGPYVIIRVSDTGHGIAPENLDRIYDPFFTTREVGKAAGLGLSTVMTTVRSLSGFIHVKSEVGRGSSFTIYLPAATAGPPQSKSADSPFGAGETILVVDDEPGILRSTCRLLKRRGYEVYSAGDGAEALGLYTEHQEEISAVLTDIMMPTMDGIDLSRVLMQMNPEAKIMAVSALEEDSKFEELRKIGVKMFLAKPYTADRLLGDLRKVING